MIYDKVLPVNASRTHYYADSDKSEPSGERNVYIEDAQQVHVIGLMIYEMIFVGDWLILYPYFLILFYVPLPHPPSPILGNKFKMIGVPTCYFGVIISCVRYG